MEEALEPDGFNVLNACRPAAWQTVFHFHLHVVPRYEDDPLKLPWIPPARRPGRDRGGGRSEIRGERAEWLSRRSRCSSATATSASIVLSNPPLNLFTDDAFDELDDCVDEIEGSDARAAVWRAEGEIFTGGVDVSVFQRSSTPGRSGERVPGR